MFNRLQGKPFATEHTPTTALQSTKISWNYRASHNVVNIEVWDCVDVAGSRTPQNKALKIGNDSSASDSSPSPNMYDELDLDSVPVAGKTPAGSSKTQLGAIDSSVVDVLRGTHAVILIFNPTKKSSWEYVKRELASIPQKVQVLVMANFKDVLEAPDVITLSSDTIDATEARAFLKQVSRGGREVYFLESSMLNCFGLKGLKTFLNLPFLILQREYLETQLEQNTLDLRTSNEEYRLTTESDSYTYFVQALNTRHAATASNTSNPGSLASSAANLGQSQESKRGTSSGSNTSSPAAGRSSDNNGSATPTKEKTPSQKIPKKPTAPVVSPVIASPSPTESGSGFFSKVFGKKKVEEPTDTEATKAIDELRRMKEAGKQPSTSNVDDFVVEEDSSWLADDNDDDFSPKKPKAAAKKATVSAPKKTFANADSDDDDDNGGPQIAAYDDELDDMDAMIAARKPPAEPKKVASILSQQNASSGFSSSPATSFTQSSNPSSPSVAPKKVTPVSNADSDDSDDDGGNPMLAGYEEELDFDDQKITGKAQPPKISTPTMSAASASKDSLSAGSPSQATSASHFNAASPNASQPASKGFNQDSDSDEEDNPHLAKDEDYDFGDFAPVATPTKSSPQVAPKAVVAEAPKPAQSPSVVAQKPIISSSPAPKATPVRAAVVADSDSDDDNNMASSDEDSDEEYAGFVPKKSAAVSSPFGHAAPAHDPGLLDFNPMDADSDADADAFWATSRAPARKVTSAVAPSSTVTQQQAANLSHQHHPQQHQHQPQAPPSSNDSFGYVDFSSDASNNSNASSPAAGGRPGGKDKKEKHKHKDKKDKHHKHKDKSSSRSSPQQSHQSQQQQAGFGAPQDDWGFASNSGGQPFAQPFAQPPVATQPPPQAAPKKSVFYL